MVNSKNWRTTTEYRMNDMRPRRKRLQSVDNSVPTSGNGSIGSQPILIEELEANENAMYRYHTGHNMDVRKAKKSRSNVTLANDVGYDVYRKIKCTLLGIGFAFVAREVRCSRGSALTDSENLLGNERCAISQVRVHLSSMSMSLDTMSP
jgi:hypothetical protein